VGGAGSCNFPTDNYKLLTEDIMDAKKFNFAPTFPQWKILAPNFCIFGRKFSDKLKFRWGDNCP